MDIPIDAEAATKKLQAALHMQMKLAKKKLIQQMKDAIFHVRSDYITDPEHHTITDVLSKLEITLNELEIQTNKET